MKKPNGYEEARVFGEYKPLPSDGYVCEIKQVREQYSRNGNPMIVVALDIAEGEYKGYFEKAYKADTRPEKKWGCNVYQLAEDKDGNCTSGFKTFITSVEKSNPGFVPVWGDMFCSCFKGKLVGGLFGREQYQKNDGSLGWSTKCVNFRSAETIRDGEFTIPEDKLFGDQNSYVPATPNSYVPATPNPNNGYEEVTDEELPF